MTALTLFEISKEFRHITDVLMDSGCDEQTLADTLEGEQWPLEIKAQQYAFAIRNLEAVAAAKKDAEAAMKKSRESYEKRIAYLKERLKTGMEIAGVSKLECAHFAISIRKNPPAVDVWDEKQIPAKFMRTPEPPPPPEPAPDRAAISAAIKAGEDVPGAKQVQGTRIEIK